MPTIAAGETSRNFAAMEIPGRRSFFFGLDITFASLLIILEYGNGGHGTYDGAGPPFHLPL